MTFFVLIPIREYPIMQLWLMQYTPHLCNSLFYCLSLQEKLTDRSTNEISRILCTVALDLKEQSVEITFFACIANSPFCHNFPVSFIVALSLSLQETLCTVAFDLKEQSVEITFFACIANSPFCHNFPVSFIVALSLSLQETLTHPSLPKEISRKCAISRHQSILCYFT